MTRRLPLLICALLGSALAPSAADATPIVPGTTPLWMELDTTELPEGCPSADALNGADMLTAIRQAPTRARGELVVTLTLLDSLLGQPTVLACDPAKRATKTILGPITGDSALTTRDRAFWGERAIVGSATEGAAGLRPGDRVDLPALGASATVDLTVAAGDATTTVRVPASADPPVSTRVTGTVVSPSLAITRLSGREETQPITTPAAGRFRLRWSRRGERVRVRIASSPDVVTELVAEDAFDTAIIGGRGATTLKVRVPRRGTAALLAFAHNPKTRASWFTRCSTRPRRPVRCGAVQTDPSAFTEALFGPAFFSDRTARASALARPLARAQRLLGMPNRSARRHRAAAHASTPLVAATVAGVDRLDGVDPDRGLSAGDVNGDGLPDVVTIRRGEPTNLRVSQGAGSWRSVRLKGGGRISADLDGDGRAELVDTRSSVVVTDAFAGGAAPTVIDLTARRVPRPRDLVFGDSNDLSLVPGLASATVPDTTGDGRPELVSESGALGVLPSEALPYGRQARLADIFPSAALGPLEVMRAVDDDTTASSTDVAWQVDAQRLFTLAPRDPRAVDATPRPIDLDERDPTTGDVRARRTFSAAGQPTLADLDARSGDALVVTETGNGCRESFELSVPGLDEPPTSTRTPGCLVRVLRIDSAGRVVATITARRSADQRTSAVFAPDASDADGQLEVLVALTGYLNPGELHVAGSSVAGTVRLDQLPRLDLGGRRRDDLVGDLSVTKLPNGSRWPAIVTVPVTGERESAPNELLLVQPK